MSLSRDVNIKSFNQMKKWWGCDVKAENWYEDDLCRWWFCGFTMKCMYSCDR